MAHNEKEGIEAEFTREFEQQTDKGPIAQRAEQRKKDRLAERVQLENDKKEEQKKLWDKQAAAENKLFQERDMKFRKTKSIDEIRKIADRYDILIEEIKKNTEAEFDELDKKYSELKAKKGFM
jgi:hypothetical protein